MGFGYQWKRVFLSGERKYMNKDIPLVEYARLEVPKVESRLLVNENFQIEFVNKRPCLWWRLWQWIFFGFVWEEI